MLCDDSVSADPHTIVLTTAASDRHILIIVHHTKKIPAATVGQAKKPGTDGWVQSTGCWLAKSQAQMAGCKVQGVGGAGIQALQHA